MCCTPFLVIYIFIGNSVAWKHPGCFLTLYTAVLESYRHIRVGSKRTSPTSWCFLYSSRSSGVLQHLCKPNSPPHCDTSLLAYRSRLFRDSRLFQGEGVAALNYVHYHCQYDTSALSRVRYYVTSYLHLSNIAAIPSIAKKRDYYFEDLGVRGSKCGANRAIYLLIYECLFTFHEY